MLRSLLSLKVDFFLLFLLLKFNSQQNACEQGPGLGHKRKEQSLRMFCQGA